MQTIFSLLAILCPVLYFLKPEQGPARIFKGLISLLLAMFSAMLASLAWGKTVSLVFLTAMCLWFMAAWKNFEDESEIY